MKTFIWIGIFVGGTVGSVVGAWLDHGNYFGLWSILLGLVGSIAGIWGGYKLGNG